MKKKFRKYKSWVTQLYIIEDLFDNLDEKYKKIYNNSILKN